MVGLTLDENGIPKTAEGRFEIAKRIVARAEALGIDRRDVYIDCLTLTVSAEQDACRETLRALHRVKTELGCKTCLGVSNISFGLPNRELVNSTFLTMALEEGLDLPIINPNIAAMTGAVRAYRVLAGIDKNSSDFISSYNDAAPVVKPQQASFSLEDAVRGGLKNEGAQATEQLLADTDPMEIVNSRLIPALDRVGEDFEKGKIFLPQLIQSANTAQVCFDVIKKHLSAAGDNRVSKGKIILATVKGDIHDIGKNIVKVLLDNYGYTVVDLGRDVEPQLIVRTKYHHDRALRADDDHPQKHGGHHSPCPCDAGAAKPRRQQQVHRFCGRRGADRGLRHEDRRRLLLPRRQGERGRRQARAGINGIQINIQLTQSLWVLRFAL